MTAATVSRIRAVAALLVAAFWLGLGVPPATARVVAVGDVHGELEGFTALLRETGLVDEEGGWSGGDATLVQTGDVLDRGPGVRGVVDLLRRLQEEAPETGGEVVVLMGNHEGMNALGVMRDVSPAAVAAFADEGSEELRRRGLEAWEEWLEARARWRGDPPPVIGDEERRAWLDAHPPGWIEYVEAMGPEGEYGTWIRDLPVAAVRADTLFMHAGLAPHWADVVPEELGKRHRKAFAAADRTREVLVERGLAPFWADREAVYETLTDLGAALEGDGGVEPPVTPQLFRVLAEGFEGVRWTSEAASPLWFRGYADWPDEAIEIHVDRVLEEQGVERLVAGHSPTDSREVVSRAGGRLFLIDTGMLAEHYGGRPSALVLEGGEVGMVTVEPAGDAAGGAAAETAAESAGTTAVGGTNGDVDDPEAGAGTGSEERLSEQGEAGGPPERVLRGRDGEPLPFADDEAVLAFLRHAEIVDDEPLNVGVTGARRMVLELGGRRLRAVFHDVDRKELGPTRLATGETTMHFIDSYRSQIAAYELARLLGFRTVPPTVERTVQGDPGSLQLWIEGATTWGAMQEGGPSAPDPVRRRAQMDDMWVFDNLIGNTDRNQGNILFDPDWNLWWIDNTRAFSQEKKLPAPERVLRVSRKLWDAIREVDEKAIREALSDSLSRFEINALLARRERLVELVEEKIAEQGEERVVFEYGAVKPAVKVTIEGEG